MKSQGIKLEDKLKKKLLETAEKKDKKEDKEKFLNF